MIKTIIFLILSIPVVSISWRSLHSIKNHGFYRFIAWECILWLAISNIVFWFKDPLAVHQIVSWILLFSSIYPILSGAVIMKKAGKADRQRDNSLYAFEKTSQLIETGIFKYIRHPLYCSLLLLTWGIFFKHFDYFLLIVAVVSSLALLLTAMMEEKENISYFGDQYREYMKRTSMFVPFII
jgi:protein-S-isoprenylcysteine O-methyltransferase Ste14